MVALIAGHKACKDALGGVRVRLLHHHPPEAPFQRRVLLDAPAVLLLSGGADDLYLAPGQQRFEDAGGVDGSLRRARAHDDMDLVNEQDGAAAVSYTHLFTDEMKIPYAVDLSPEDGADAVERQGDHEDSPYFAHPDYYNMKSSDTLTILTGFQTMQQTSEWACGVTSSLMVLNWYDQMGDWNEESLAALRHSLDGTELEGYPGTTLKQACLLYTSRCV